MNSIFCTNIPNTLLTLLLHFLAFILNVITMKKNIHNTFNTKVFSVVDRIMIHFSKDFVTILKMVQPLGRNHSNV